MISGLAWLQLLDHHILDVRRDRRVARAREVGPELEIVTNSRHPRGDSPGQAPRQPRQVVDVTGQLEDWQRAVSFARLLPGVALSQAEVGTILWLRRKRLSGSKRFFSATSRSYVSGP